MTFTIHINSRHCESAGLDNEYREWDEPCDEDIDIEIDDEQAHGDIAEMIYISYIRDGLLMRKVPKEVREQIIDRLKLLFDDLDVWDMLEEDYQDELREKYENEYDNDY